MLGTGAEAAGHLITRKNHTRKGLKLAKGNKALVPKRINKPQLMINSL